MRICIAKSRLPKKTRAAISPENRKIMRRHDNAGSPLNYQKGKRVEKRYKETTTQPRVTRDHCTQAGSSLLLSLPLPTQAFPPSPRGHRSVWLRGGKGNEIAHDGERYLRELGRGGSPGTSIRAHLTHNTQLSLSLISVILSHAQDTTRKSPLPLPDHAVVRCGLKDTAVSCSEVYERLNPRRVYLPRPERTRRSDEDRYAVI